MRLIASDLDGTLLLNKEKNIHRLTELAIEKILNKDIVFCVASGRNYSELKRLLSAFSDRIYFIANDGALIVHKGKSIYETPIKKEHMKLFSKEDNIVAHGKYVSYVKSKSERFIRQVKEQYFGHILATDSITDINEPIYKITLYDTTNQEFDLDRVYYKNSMYEYAEKGINKGKALSHLLEILKLSEKDAVAIGDNINDIEMLKSVGKSYVISNAPPKVKKFGTYIVDEFKDAVENMMEE